MPVSNGRMGLAELFANNAIVKLLRGDTGKYDLMVSMVGTRLGDRLLVVGGGDGQLVAALGGPTGLTGRICAVEADAPTAARVARGAEAGGVLAEIETSPLAQLPYEEGSFDVVVLPTTGGTALAGADVRRVLRQGGRLVVIAKAQPGSSEPILGELGRAGFRTARLIATRAGLAFYEAVRLG
jgi:ubiquinone/menaquinone biosynthesis C-methylase UbiE